MVLIMMIIMIMISMKMIMIIMIMIKLISKRGSSWRRLRLEALVGKILQPRSPSPVHRATSANNQHHDQDHRDCHRHDHQDQDHHLCHHDRT